MYVAPFSSRPVLHIRNSTGAKPPYALVFADAVARYGDSLEEEDLFEAYRRAGSHFDGQLRQTFVVLKEDPRKQRILPQPQRGGYQRRPSSRPYRGRGGGSGGSRGGYQGRYNRGGGGGYTFGSGDRGARTGQPGTPGRGTKRSGDEQNQNQNQTTELHAGAGSSRGTGGGYSFGPNKRTNFNWN